MSASRPFARTETCSECPFLRNVAPGRFPPERFAALRRTAEQGFNTVFACHKSPEGHELACAGYLLVAGNANWTVRIAAARGQFDATKIRATGPLYASYEEMEQANAAVCK